MVGMLSSVGEAGAVVRILSGLYGASVRRPKPSVRLASIIVDRLRECGFLVVNASVTRRQLPHSRTRAVRAMV